MECDRLPHSEHAGFVCKRITSTTPHRRNRFARASPLRSSFDFREIYTNTFVAVNEYFRSYSPNRTLAKPDTARPQSRNFKTMDRLNRISLSRLFDPGPQPLLSPVRQQLSRLVRQKSQKNLCEISQQQRSRKSLAHHSYSHNGSTRALVNRSLSQKLMMGNQRSLTSVRPGIQKILIQVTWRAQLT